MSLPCRRYPYPRFKKPSQRCELNRHLIPPPLVWKKSPPNLIMTTTSPLQQQTHPSQSHVSKTPVPPPTLPPSQIVPQHTPPSPSPSHPSNSSPQKKTSSSHHGTNALNPIGPAPLSA